MSSTCTSTKAALRADVERRLASIPQDVSDEAYILECLHQVQAAASEALAETAGDRIIGAAGRGKLRRLF